MIASDPKTLDTMTLEVEDFNGQIRRRATGIPRSATVNDLIESISSELQLPRHDPHGRDILYGARTTDGDMLNPTDEVGDVLEDEQVVTLTTSVTAG